MNRKSKIGIVIAAVTVVALVVVLALFYRGQAQTSDLPNSTSSASPIGQSPLTPSATPATCPSEPTEFANPTSMLFMEQNIEVPMMTTGYDPAEEAAAAPPGDQGYMVGWYSESPKPGSSQGKVALSAHTFRFGSALGNDLIDGFVSEGDTIMLRDDQGNSACYRYSGSHHVLLEDYDPDSDVYYDYTGDPKIAIIVCSDYTASGDTLGRMIFYGDLMTGDQS